MADTDLLQADNLKESSSGRAFPFFRQPSVVNTFRRILHEPVFHFLLLGALLFLLFYWRGGGADATSTHIAITHAQIEQLILGFERTWQKPPTQAELKGLIDEYIKEEIATREAVAMGLDRDDVIVRRRLRQKLEFMVDDTSAPLGDAELNDWMAKHPDAFRSDPRVSFRQVYVSPQRHGTSMQQDAVKLLARLKAAGPNASIEHLGDPTMLPTDESLSSVFDISRSFGDAFAQELMNVETGQWVGPVESSYGLHLVLVTQRIPGAQQPLSAVRQQVERELQLERKKEELQAMYDRLLQKYTVQIESLPPVSKGGAAK